MRAPIENATAERVFVVETHRGRLLIAAPDADVASYRARRRGFRVVSVVAR
jgi:hypothetical protein